MAVTLSLAQLVVGPRHGTCWLATTTNTTEKICD